MSRLVSLISNMSEGGLYNFSLPKELIAQAPAEPRDSSRLFVYDTTEDSIVIDTFKNLAKYLTRNSLVVLNNTQVVPARLSLKKRTGGSVTILFLFNEWDRGEVIKGLPDKSVKIGHDLFIGDKAIIQAASHKDEEYSWKLLISAKEFEELCNSNGRTPLPPYIDSKLSESERRSKYQTIFAAKPASVAAPTASLHFTDGVFGSFKERGISITNVTLHVGRGTFSPVTEKTEEAGVLHEEPICISKESVEILNRAQKESRPIIAAGTTVLRTLESVANEIRNNQSVDTATRIFIRPPYDFKIVNGLVTNFHLPNTSLLMLLDAFLQSKNARKSWRELYEIAIAEKFRFYSFGDAMLII